MTPAELPIDVLRDARLVHASGISMAISQSACDTVLHAFETDENDNPYFQTAGITTATTLDDTFTGNNTGNARTNRPASAAPTIAATPVNAKHSAIVKGISKLRGATVDVPDVRAGFSSVIAAAAAEGASTLHGIHHLERGYNAPFETLVSLGLRLSRV